MECYKLAMIFIFIFFLDGKNNKNPWIDTEQNSQIDFEYVQYILNMMAHYQMRQKILRWPWIDIFDCFCLCVCLNNARLKKKSQPSAPHAAVNYRFRAGGPLCLSYSM